MMKIELIIGDKDLAKIGNRTIAIPCTSYTGQADSVITLVEIDNFPEEHGDGTEGRTKVLCPRLINTEKNKTYSHMMCYGGDLPYKGRKVQQIQVGVCPYLRPLTKE